MKNTLKNFSYSIGANLVSLAISTLMILIVPKLIGVVEYGYWQLYTFYSSYVGFFQFGICDGMYLRNGGAYYEKLDKPLFTTQFWFLTCVEILVSIVLAVLLFFSSSAIEKKIILFFVISSIVLVISKAFLSYILQTTSKIKEYSIILISEKFVYGFLIVFLLIFKINSYMPLLIADIIGKIISLCFSVYFCRSIVFGKLRKISLCYKEITENFLVGSKLMLANIAGMLILGVVRVAIEDNWSIEVFGRISLSISISNMLMIFINAIGIVIFPILKRIDMRKMTELYDQLRNVLMVVAFALMLTYFPLRSILSNWLPKYIESLRYMALLFPICIFETKMSLLINTYLKALRKEKIILVCNLVTVSISVFLTLVNVYVFNNLVSTVISIVFLLGFRCVISELCLSMILKKKLYKDIIVEIILSIIFMFCGWTFADFTGGLFYCLFLFLYFFIKRKDIFKFTNFIVTRH